MAADSIVLVHGTRTSASQWDLQLPGLREAGFEVVTPDLPGHGARRGEPFTLDAALSAIAGAVAEAAGALEGGSGRRVHLVGSSLGGMLAIHAAAERADLRRHLASLTVCGAAVQPGPRTAQLYGAAMRAVDRLPRAIGMPAPSGAHDDVLEEPSGALPAVSAPATSRLLTGLLGARGARAYVRGGRAGPEVVAPAMEAISGLDLRADLGRIHVPVTILSPRFDQLRLHERSFARAAPRGRLVRLGYGSHLVNLNRPERFTADLVRVLHESGRT